MPLVEHWDLGENRILTQTTPQTKNSINDYIIYLQKGSTTTATRRMPPVTILEAESSPRKHRWRMNYRTGCKLHGSWFLDVLQGLVVSGNTKQRNHNHPLEKTMRGNHRRDSNHPKPSVIRSMVGMNPRLASLVSNQMVSRHVLIVRQVNGIFIWNQSRANSQDTHN